MRNGRMINYRLSSDRLSVDVYKMICEAYEFNDAYTPDADQKQQKQKFHTELILDGII